MPFAFLSFCRRFLTSALSMMLFGLVSVNAYAETFTFCYEDQHLPPFVIDVSVPPVGKRGYFPDLVDLAAESVSVNIEYIRLPWRRCQEELKENRVDGIFAFVWTEERSHWAAFPTTDNKADDRYGYLSQYAIFTGLNSNITWDGTHLLPITAKIQSVPGYVTDMLLQQMGFEPVFDVLPSKGLELVARQRLDGYIVDSIIGSRLVNQAQLNERLVSLEKPFLSQPLYVAFSKSAYQTSPKEIERFWDSFKIIRNQVGQVLLDKYKDL